MKQKITLLRFLKEYKNINIKTKIEKLSEQYEFISGARGDGNCFYRSV